MRIRQSVLLICLVFCLSHVAAKSALKTSHKQSLPSTCLLPVQPTFVERYDSPALSNIVKVAKTVGDIVKKYLASTRENNTTDTRNPMFETFSDIHYTNFQLFFLENEQKSLLGYPEKYLSTFAAKIAEDPLFSQFDRTAVWAEFITFVTSCKTFAPKETDKKVTFFFREYPPLSKFEGWSITHTRAWTTSECTLAADGRPQITTFTGANSVTGDLYPLAAGEKRDNKYYEKASRWIFDSVAQTYAMTFFGQCKCIQGRDLEKM